jgi:hypothetical protein
MNTIEKNEFHFHIYNLFYFSSQICLCNHVNIICLFREMKEKERNIKLIFKK